MGVGFCQDKVSPVASALCDTGDGQSLRERHTVPSRACVCVGGHLETPRNAKQGPQAAHASLNWDQ